MLREYRLTNFKAFGETVTIPIRPLTLIFGANSSGKSSIFQSLLMLKQTLEEAKNPNTALWSKGSLVDLGPYRDFVHRHETERDFGFGARFDLESGSDVGPAGVTNAGLAFRFSYDERKYAAAPPRVDLTIGDDLQPLILDIGRNVTINFESEFWRQWWNNMRGHFDDLLAIGYSAELGEKKCDVEELKEILENSLLEDVINDLREMSGSKREDNINKTILALEKRKDPQQEDALSMLKEVKGSLPLPDVEYENFIPDIVELFVDSPTREQSIFNAQLCIMTNYPTEYGDTADYGDIYDRNFREESNRSIRGVVAHLCAPLSRFLASLVYLGPLRRHPERHYEFNGDTTDYVGQSGEYLPSILFEDQELVKQTNSDLERLGVKYEVKLSKFQDDEGSPSNIFALRLVDTETKTYASLRDVGFGLSQVLPIVAQSRLSEKKTLLIEQPEIHLHPAHQAELGDMFIRSALGEQKNTLLLETHSEHLLLRIMRRMRETSTGTLPEGAIAVRPEDVAVLFVESDGSQSIVREMPLDERGELVKAWPGGFFEEGLREVL